MGKQGDSRGEREIGEATHADFYRAVYLFFLFYFVLFSPVSFFFFFKKKKVVPTTLYTCFLSDDGFQTIIYNRDLNITEP